MYRNPTLLSVGCLIVACSSPPSPTDSNGTDTGRPTADTTVTDTQAVDTATTDTAAPESLVHVVLLGGQSNMAGRAATDGLPEALQGEQGDVRIFYAGQGSVQTDSLVPLQPGTGAQFGPEVTLGRTLADAFPGRRYALIKYARGGTNLFDQWDPASGAEYATFLDTVDRGLRALEDEGLTPRIEGMVWHQGESDAVEGRTTEEYAADLTEFVEAVRADVSGASGMRFVVGRLSELQLPGDGAGRDAIQDAQLQVAAADPDVGIVFTDSFRLAADNLHYDAMGQHAMGVRFAQALNPDRASSAVSRFDLGTTGATFHEDGWLPVEAPDLAPAPLTVVDEDTGFSITLGLDAGDPGLVTRSRNPIAATQSEGFTLDNVYVDFINVDTLALGNLDASRTYDVQVIMFDDDQSDLDRTQTVFDVTGGANDDLGTSHGAGVGNTGVLDDHAYSVFGTGLVPDASGPIALEVTNSEVFAAVVNGVVITERP